jgi:hypothetical protein
MRLGPTDVSGFAPSASPTFTGTPAAPTAAVDTNTTQVSTTAFVVGQAASATPLIDGSAAVGTSLRYARGDHVHPTDTTRAALASPTLTGTPAAPTAAVDTNTTQIATTAYVIAQAAAATPLIDAGAGAVGTATRFARADHVHPLDSGLSALATDGYVTKTSFTPTFSFATVGDLSVAYSSQAGQWSRIGKIVFYNLNIGCTPTFTTSSGSLELNLVGLPTSDSTLNCGGQLTSQTAGLTWPASKTMVIARVGANSTKINLIGFQTASATATISTTGVVSGAAVTIAVTGWYLAA